jgi:hypothetical protein
MQVRPNSLTKFLYFFKHLTMFTAIFSHTFAVLHADTPTRRHADTPTRRHAKVGSNAYLYEHFFITNL